MNHSFKAVIFAFFVLLLIFKGSFLFGQEQPKFSNSIVKEGYADLRGNDFETNIKLCGEWKIYWQQLIQPHDKLPAQGYFTYFPQRFDNTFLNGKQLPAQGFATYSATILLPTDKGELSLQVPDVYTSYKLFINGKAVSENGSVGKAKETTTPYSETKVVQLEPMDTMRILFQVANFHHAKGGPYKNFIIGKRTQITREYNKIQAIDFVLSGCFFIGGLFFLALYFFGQKDKATLYFASFCITYTYRIVGSGACVLHHVIYGVPWFVTTKLEYLSLCLTIFFLVQYISHQYPKDSPKRLVKISAISTLAFFFVVLISSPLFFTGLINIFLLIMFANLILGMYVYGKAYKNKREGAVYLIISIAIILSIFIISTLVYFRYIDPMPVLISILYMLFLFLQALILAFRFSYTLNQAKQLAEQGLIAKTEFLSVMSHEIRTPLNSVIGFTHLLLRNEPRQDQEKELEAMLFSANNLLSIVNNILDLNKIEAGKIILERIEMDIISTTRSIINGMKASAEDKGIELLLIVDNELQNKVIGDPTRLTQVITNLVHNAIKFTSQGKVELEIKVAKKGQRTITITFSVKDTGIGILPEKQGKIFDTFTQADSSTSRSYGGTGLGLAISKKIIEAYGSELHLKSIPGQGSEFSFTLHFPIVHHQKEVSKKQLIIKTEKETELRNVQILLVEDNAINVLVGKSFLDRWGAITDVASNGKEALEMLDINKHQIILMDLHMPIMDGYEATRQIRQKGINIPIIALTAKLQTEMEEDIHKAGLTDIVVKPFAPEELYRILLLYIKK